MCIVTWRYICTGICNQTFTQSKFQKLTLLRYSKARLIIELQRLFWNTVNQNITMLYVLQAFLFQACLKKKNSGPEMSFKLGCFFFFFLSLKGNSWGTFSFGGAHLKSCQCDWNTICFIGRKKTPESYRWLL